MKPWNSRFSRAVNWSSSEGSWKISPMRWRTASGCRTTSSPATSTSPLVGLRRVQRVLMVVDLPAPLGPRNPKTSPAVTSRSIPLTASRSPYFLTSPRTLIIGRHYPRSIGSNRWVLLPWLGGEWTSDGVGRDDPDHRPVRVGAGLEGEVGRARGHDLAVVVARLGGDGRHLVCEGPAGGVPVAHQGTGAHAGEGCEDAWIVPDQVDGAGHRAPVARGDAVGDGGDAGAVVVGADGDVDADRWDHHPVGVGQIEGVDRRRGRRRSYRRGRWRWRWRWLGKIAGDGHRRGGIGRNRQLVV